MSEYTKINRSSFASSSARTTYDQGLRSYMLQVYNLMGIALTITGFVALVIANIPPLAQALYGTSLQFVVLLAPLGFAIYFGAKLNSISATTAKNYLWIFAVLMGLSLGGLFLIYTGASLARCFFITASLFGAMSLYGYTTKKDLTNMGSFLMMGLIGVIIASAVNIFLKSSGLAFAVSILSVLIFTGLTAYDSQKIKSMYYQFSGNAEMTSKASTMGALSLYMDFINIFLVMLRFFGDRR
jgi:uncharacterized protein